MPAYLDQSAANLRRGLADGRVGVAMLVRKVDDGIGEILARPDAEWALMQPADAMPELRDRLLQIIGHEIRPALERYRAVVVEEIGPRAIARAGHSAVWAAADHSASSTAQTSARTAITP